MFAKCACCSIINDIPLPQLCHCRGNNKILQNPVVNEGEMHQKKNHKTKQIQHFYKIKPNSENALHKDGKYLKLLLKLMWLVLSHRHSV
jgi:hypothetical protein